MPSASSALLVEVQLHFFLTSILNTNEWPTSPTRKEPRYLLYKEPRKQQTKTNKHETCARKGAFGELPAEILTHSKK
jgi:hypothetical protein